MSSRSYSFGMLPTAIYWPVPVYHQLLQERFGVYGAPLPCILWHNYGKPVDAAGSVQAGVYPPTLPLTSSDPNSKRIDSIVP